MTAPILDASFIRQAPSLQRSLAVTASLIVLAATGGWTQTQTTSPATKTHTKTDPKINEPFRKPDVNQYIKRFESGDRETYLKRHEIVAALGLRKGMTVADVGAGTGLFTRPIADLVGSTGKVYAVDIARPFLDHIAAEAKRHRQRQVVTILCNQETTNLPAESVDLVFLCDVYHHLENPERTLASIRQALKSRGELVVIDFDRREGRSAEFVLKHVRAGKETFRKEIEAAGFTQISTAEPPFLKENFFLHFQKTPVLDAPGRNQRRQAKRKDSPP
jgi:SAM-dependent methyltransferase